ncbi:MAG: response regulator [Butyrivibrio sp.]|nr:response regulator [Butyrivibrio sp.]
MELKYNIYLEAAVIPIDIILCVFLKLKYTEKTRVNKEFRHLAYLIAVSTIIDVVDAIIISMGPEMPLIIKYLANIIDYVSATITSYQFVHYVMAFVGSRWKESTGAYINRILLVIYLLIIVTNPITGIIFAYSPMGHYIAGPLFMMIVYAYPFYYILYGGVFILSHNESYSKQMKHALVATFFFVIFFYLLQMLYVNELLVSFFVASVSLLVLYLTLETPDYTKLMKTLDELSVSRKELEASSIRAAEMSRTKSRFLAQMSNEIRTPVNAIMGYSNLILADSKEDTSREYAQRVKISAKRLLTFFENVLNYVSDEDDENGPRRLPSMAELVDQTENTFDNERDTTAEHKAISGAAQIRVLVVDDADLNIDLLVRILRPIGFTVDTANNGKQAIMQVRKFRYDLIFMDHLMPIMDGVEALKHLREENLCDDTPIVMLTANAVAGEEEKYRKMGFAAYVTKPFTEDSIRDILKKFLPITEQQWQGEVAISEWEALQEKLPTVRVADAREYLLHSIKAYKNILKTFAEVDMSTEFLAAIRRGDYIKTMAIITSEHDDAVLIGAESLANMSERLESLCRRGEYELLRERTGAYFAERNMLSEQIKEL